MYNLLASLVYPHLYLYLYLRLSLYLYPYLYLYLSLCLWSVYLTRRPEMGRDRPGRASCR